MTDQDPLAAFRALPLSSEAWLAVSFLGGTASLPGLWAISDIHSRAVPLLLLATSPPALMACYVVFAEKVIGKKPDRTLAPVRVHEVEAS